MVRRIVLLVLVVAALTAALLWSQRPRGPLVVSGFVEAHEVRVGSLVGGRVDKIGVEEGQRVAPGDELVVLEPFDLEERRAEAQAELGVRRAELDLLRQGFRPEEIAERQARRDRLAAQLERQIAGPRPQEIETARAQVELATAQLELARQEHQRAQQLHEGGVASPERLDRAVSELRVAEAALEVRRQELALLLEGTRKEDIAAARAELAEADAALQLAQHGYRAEDIARAEAAVAAAVAALGVVEDQAAEIVVRAPSAGVVEAVELRRGDLVAPGAPVLSLLDPSALWVRAYVPENRLVVAPGETVEVRVDSFPDRSFRGRVGFIARQAEFTPGNVQTPEERSKQVFRIKVDLEEGLDVLRPGMAADVVLASAR